MGKCYRIVNSHYHSLQVLLYKPVEHCFSGLGRFLNQARRPARTWFIRIASVRECLYVYVCVCVCVCVVCVCPPQGYE